MSDPVYRIAKWNDVFERSDTRKVTRALKWVAMPTSFSSHGYHCLLDEFGDEAPAIYGAWCALVAVAANCTVRGVLSNSRGRALPLTHLVRMSGFPPGVFQKLIEWASREEIQWLEVVDNPELLCKSAASDVPSSEADSSPVENTDFPEEKRASRQSPDNLPAISRQSPGTPGNHPAYQTRQDKTLHNTTRPDQTVGRSVVGRSSGESPLAELLPAKLLEVESSEVDRVCRLIVRSLPFGVDGLQLGRMVRIGLASGVRSQMLETCKAVGSPSVRNHRRYWDGAVRKMVSEAGFDFDSAMETLRSMAEKTKEFKSGAVG